MLGLDNKALFSLVAVTSYSPSGESDVSAAGEGLSLPVVRAWKPRSRRRSPRLAASVAETVVATALLAIAMSGVGRFAYHLKEGLRNREIGSRIELEMLNLREEVGSWEIADINPQRVEEFPISTGLQAIVEEPHWEAQVVRVSKPAEAVQVTLRLKCRIQGQAASPAERTFWIVGRTRSEPQIESGDADD
ncbi:MAG: hypothetical protein NXI32_00790 [bacterium]|nr:hypothetical protein [bacterium]